MYNYQEEKQRLFTEEWQVRFIKIRDNVNVLLETAGCFTMLKAISNESGNTWTLMACVDRLVELGEIKEIHREDVPSQYRIFTFPRR